MQADREFPFHRWFEVVAWLGLGALSIALLVLPLSDSLRTAFGLFLIVLALYFIFTFHFLFPRSGYAPRVIYSTLIIDVFIVGVLRLLLADYFPNYELAFIPLIALAALVASWHGVLALALFAALVDFVTQLRLLAIPRDASSLPTLLNQGLIAMTFAVTGMVILLLTEIIRRRVDESAQAAFKAAQSEHEQRAQAERAARRWELLNAVGLKVQVEVVPGKIFQVIGSELQALGLECMVGLWEEVWEAEEAGVSALPGGKLVPPGSISGAPGRLIRPVYVSLSHALLQNLEHLLGVTHQELRLGLGGLPEFQTANAERRAVYFRASPEMVQRIVPHISPEVVSQAMGLIAMERVIVVPLFTRELMLGMFAVWGRDLETADLAPMTGLAQEIAIAFERARLLGREQKRAAQLMVVNDIATRAAGLLDVDDLLDEITRSIVQRLSFENSAVLLSSPGTRQLILRAHAGSAINRQEIGYRQSWDIGLIGAAARTGKTVLVNDVKNDPRYHTSDAAHDICHGEICIPLKRGSETVGVLDVQSTSLNAFDHSDVATLETLANQIAAAIEKLELFERERKRAAQLALVSAIAERITAILDPDRLLDQVTRLILEQFGYYNVAILILEPGGSHVRLGAVSGGYVDLFPPDFRQSIQVGLIGAAARTGTTVVANDVDRDERFYFPETHSPVTGAEMSVPLRMGNQVLGVLDIQSTNVNAFEASDVAAMETLANQIAVALENARLYAETKDEAEVKATLLRELSHRVKNNLAAIVGLLYLGLEDETMSRDEVLNETLTRVQSMALAHTVLADSPHARADVLDLARRVLSDSVHRMTLPGQVLPFSVRGEPVEISAHQAATLALILNELITNAIKHRDQTGSPELCLSVQRAGAQLRLEFFSQGNHLPDEITGAAGTAGLGLQLIHTLVAKDLNGTITMTTQDEPCGVLNVILFEPEP